MAYVMSAKAYWNYIEKHRMTHEELIVHLNQSFGIRGLIMELHISAEGR